MSAATIYDVARLARVSPVTVSRVINGNTRVGALFRQRVVAAIAALKYQVNVAARSTRIGHLRIGLLFSHPGAAFMSDVLLGAMHQCSAQGARLLLGQCGDLDSQRGAIARLIADGADAILVPPPLCELASALRELDGIGMQIVAVASAPPTAGISAVRIDDYAGARAMMNHLFAAGHRDIAFVTGAPGHAPAQLRYQAYRDAMDAAGQEVRPGRVAEGSFTYRSGLAAASQLLDRADRPSAVFACNDDMAAAVIAVAHGLDLRVPRDVAVCGFDDKPIAAALWPGLTTIRQPINALTRAAVQLAIDAIGEPRRARQRVLPFTLVTRESTAGGAGGAGRDGATLRRAQAGRTARHSGANPAI
ncbi:MAG: LacI family DNA-binding transcriptional regulator [Massilia sp.]